MPQTYTVRDPQTGRTVTFVWHEPTPPTDDDIAAVFAGAEDRTGLSGFVRGAKETLLPFQSLDEAKQVGSALVSDPVGAVRAILGGAWEEMGEQRAKAGEALDRAIASAREGDLMTAVLNILQGGGHAAAGVLPFVGPAAARAGEAIGEGMPAYGAGQLTGLLAPFGASRALRSIKPPSTVSRVPLTLAERTGSAVSQFLENLTERTLPGSGVFRAFRNEQQAALIDQVAEEAVSRISSSRGTASEVGQQVQRALDEARQKLKGEASALYQAIDDMTGDQPLVPTAPLKAFATEQLNRIHAEAQLIPPQALSRSIGILQRIIDAPDRVPFHAAQDARSDLLAIARSHDPLLPGKAGGLASQLAAITDDVLMQGARESDIPDLDILVRKANELWRAQSEAFDETLLSKMVQAAPEKVHTLLRTADLKDIQRFKELLPPDVVQTAKAQLVRDMLEQAIVGETLPPVAGTELIPGVHGEPFRRLRGTSLINQLERLGKDRLSALFTPDEISDLSEIAVAADAIARKGSALVPGLVAGGVNVAILQPVFNVLTRGTLEGLGASATLSTALYLAARLMTSREGLSAFRNYMRALGHSKADQAAFWSARIGDLAAQELANEEALQQDE